MVCTANERTRVCQHETNFSRTKCREIKHNRLVAAKLLTEFPLRGNSRHESACQSDYFFAAGFLAGAFLAPALITA